MAITIDQVQIGTEVILGSGKSSNYWVPQMDQYVGQKSIITIIWEGYQNKNWAGVHGNKHAWNMDWLFMPGNFSTGGSLILVPGSFKDEEDSGIIIKAQEIKYGSTCKKCNTYNEYVEVNPDYTCAICKSWEKAWG